MYFGESKTFLYKFNVNKVKIALSLSDVNLALQAHKQQDKGVIIHE